MAEKPTGGSGLMRNAVWSALDFWTQQVVALLVFIVIGNMVGPAAVGVLTLAQVALTLMMALLLDGFSDALIQRQELERRHFDTAFWLLVGLGVGAGLLLWAAAPGLAWAFGHDELKQLLPVMALGLPCIGVTAPYQSLLQREGRFRALSLRSVLAQAGGFATAWLLARDGYGAGALVGYFLVARFVDAAALPLIARRLPGFGLDRRALADIFGFGKHRVGNQLVGFIVMQIDRISAGLFQSPLAVGYYAIAERIATSLIAGLSGVLARVAFPAFAARQSDAMALRTAQGDVLTVTNMLALPVFVGLAVVSPQLMGTLFSPAWAPAVPVLAILALAGVPHATNYVLTAAINARGRPDVALQYSVIIMAMRLAASLAAAPQGVLALAWANLVVTACSTLVVVAAVRRHLPEVPRLVLASLRVPTLATLGMAGICAAAGALLPGQTAPVLLAAKVAAGALAYAGLLLLLAPRSLPLLLRRAT